MYAPAMTSTIIEKNSTVRITESFVRLIFFGFAGAGGTIGSGAGGGGASVGAGASGTSLIGAPRFIRSSISSSSSPR